ncbi:facilitated trehalose transporter Tret1-like isoform X2 [Photinus pyralis]|nr:facilitated trehalose transporter Tret1-like isoform X2 [Photinus pyralis]
MVLANGMVAGYPTVLIPSLYDEKINSQSGITEDQISWIGSIGFTCSLLGCLVSGMITQPFGRARAIRLACPVLVAAWLIFLLANEMWQIYLALCFCGLSSSLVEAPIIAYKAEVSQPHLRGMLSATTSLCCVIGVLIQFTLGTFLHWRTVAAISSAFPLLAFVLLFFIPESPHWLIMRGKKETAHKNLAWLRGWTTLDEVEGEFLTLCGRCDTEQEAKASSSREAVRGSMFKKYMEKRFLWPLSLVCFIFFLSHFNGSCTLQTYAVSIFTTMKAPMDEFYATVMLGFTQVVGCFLSLFVVKYCGKRVMGMASLGAVGICNVAVGAYAFIIGVPYLKWDDEGATFQMAPYAWIPLCLLLLLSLIANTGIRVLPWILLGEVFPHETRATGCGIGSASYYLFIFISNKLFIIMVNAMTIFGVYELYAAISVVGALIMYFGLPETEGKDLDDVIDHFSEVSKLDNRVKKREQ